MNLFNNELGITFRFRNFETIEEIFEKVYYIKVSNNKLMYGDFCILKNAPEWVYDKAENYTYDRRSEIRVAFMQNLSKLYNIGFDYYMLKHAEDADSIEKLIENFKTNTHKDINSIE